ncbi:hypothetical protein N9359_04510 [Luminiphilus sp.]|nr:hypothetical protein [Luminiphilus sp.]
MKYLKRATQKHTTFTYRRRWPTDLQGAARAAGFGTFYNGATDCPVNAPELEQAKAKALGDAEYERTVGLLMIAKQQASIGVQVGGVSKLMLDKRKAKTATKLTHDLFSLLSLWQAAHPEQTKKATADRERYWQEWQEAVGANEAATVDALDSIHRGFDTWQAQMEARGVKGATVERARNSVASVLRWADTQQRIGWHIRLRPVTKQQTVGKRVLTQAEQKQLIDAVVTDNSPTAAMVAVMLAGGVMASEISRMDVAETTASLAAPIPYIVIGSQSKVKAEARRRIVPIVWSAEVLAVIQAQLPTAIVRASKASDSASTVNKYLRTRGFEKVTGHCLRHTMKAVASAAMANSFALAAVGGWAGSGLNPVMLSYGSGAADSELVASLSIEVRRWWKHLLPEQGLKLAAAS